MEHAHVAMATPLSLVLQSWIMDTADDRQLDSERVCVSSFQFPWSL